MSSVSTVNYKMAYKLFFLRNHFYAYEEEEKKDFFLAFQAAATSSWVSLTTQYFLMGMLYTLSNRTQ